jgi:hypothetical protein
VTELDAATGALVQVLHQPKYKFSRPSAVAAHGTHVWVANNSGDSVTEFPASPRKAVGWPGRALIQAGRGAAMN